MTHPLLDDWQSPFGLPDFSAIDDAEFQPAFKAALAAHEAEFAGIATNTEPPSFANTIEALERSGRKLARVNAVFWNRAVSDTNPTLQAIERDIAPRLSEHRARMRTDPQMFARIDALVQAPPMDLSAEQARVLELVHLAYVRAGARLDAAGKQRMRAINGRLAEIGAAFGQNVLADEASWSMTLEEADLEGLPEAVIETARAEAKRRGKAGYTFTLARSSVEPFLTYSARRDLRERAFRAWSQRGEAKNWPLVAETVALRLERARLLGYEHFAAFKLEDQMAATPERVEELLLAVWEPARARAAEEARALGELAADDGLNDPLAPWDWRYYAEKLRARRFAVDETEVQAYLELNQMIDAAFAVAGRLFDLSFKPVNVPLPHPDARAWEVRQGERHVGVFIGDYFARPGKRSGAWMSELRGQQGLWEPGRPVVFNTCNFAKGEPCLLSWDDARTLFHEFGHALHGLLSDVTYPTIAGTSVARDFVELPSQLFEHWLSEPEVLASHARHHVTGAPMPGELIERLQAAANFNQGFKRVEFTASALVDMAMHRLTDLEGFDPEAFEAATLEAIGMPAAIIMRHRSPHFQHVFAGDGYSAGYYSYLWSEVLDTDAFRAFEEAGGAFDRTTADSLREHILSAGGRQRPEAAYLAFRGSMPDVSALLEANGFVPAEG